nr:immunoglobulin heavy chain junction region [Macaca mulatta]MOW98113.1 immunoglobulin heavy chain junction region [Macaca mulatta]MOW98465.1 immunoglobulin heavy chain junction region [Macaca mulatta]MOW98846.1 immunoglobulin heavy chain junction region [Macaca mulatta]MOW99428.1 immunoglobulin heavy chain junction region [Macaca mulatta]
CARGPSKYCIGRDCSGKRYFDYW